LFCLSCCQNCYGHYIIPPSVSYTSLLIKDYWRFFFIEVTALLIDINANILCSRIKNAITNSILYTHNMEIEGAFSDNNEVIDVLFHEHAADVLNISELQINEHYLIQIMFRAKIRNPFYCRG